ncbi:hypothetical protein AB3515_07595 [Acinetobacter baumannii]
MKEAISEEDFSDELGIKVRENKECCPEWKFDIVNTKGKKSAFSVYVFQPTFIFF